MALIVRRASTVSDFAAIHRMQQDMAAWDAAECTALGYPGEEVAQAFYGDTAQEMQDTFAASDALLLVAEVEGAIVGHAGFFRHDADLAELCKVWVEPAARGKGTAWQLLSPLPAAMAAVGYRGAILETTVFMPSAIRLYERLGFRRCPQVRAPPFGMGPITVFMQSRF